MQHPIVATTPHGSDAGSVDPGLFSIRDLAEEFGVTLRALRFYESKGLLSPKRFGTSRLFTREDRERLALIVRAKQLGFTLKEISAFVAAHRVSNDGPRLPISPEQCREQIQHLSERKREIEAALAELQLNYAAQQAIAGEANAGRGDGG